MLVNKAQCLLQNERHFINRHTKKIVFKIIQQASHIRAQCNKPNTSQAVTAKMKETTFNST